MTAPSALIKFFYVGIIIENVLYGIELLLYFKTICVLLGNRGALKTSNLFYALFSTMMVFLITIWIVTHVVFGQNMWLLNYDYPGGANAYWKDNITNWYMDWATITVIILQLMTDGLMIHRCRVIWNNYGAIAVPVILWLVTLALGVLVAWITSLPGNDYQTGVASRLSLAYWSISVLLNTSLSCMICYRIVRHGKKIQEHVGREYASLYFTILATVVESVLPYTLTGIIFLVSLGIGSQTSSAFIDVYFLMMCISPQMLILRVVAGKAWRNDTFDQRGSTIKFSPYDADASSQSWLGSDCSSTKDHP